MSTPEFASEAEEAQWWFDNRGILTQAFEEEYPVPAGKTPVDPLLDEEDAQLAGAQAAARGITPEAYMVQLIRRALQEQKAA